MNMAIVGAGLIGFKRAASLNQSDTDKLIIVCDINESLAEELADKHSAIFTQNVDDVINNKNIDIVLVSVINKYAAEIVVAMLKSGKNVLCEKPLGRNVEESRVILSSAEKNNKIVKTGFNHRFHPAVMKAKELIKNDSIGELINIRARYGHGGRPGMEKEWRCSKELCGGGELIDQGVHIIDLCRWFTSSEVTQVYGKTFTSFWETDVEDNAFFNLDFNDGIYAQCHVSWTNWKNIFSFEIFGENGYIKINGLGGSYGKETIEVGYRQPGSGVPQIERFEYDENDNSWSLEWKDFKEAIKNNFEPNGSGQDGYMANKIVNAIYKSNKLNKPVPLS
jgi:predicted dehydrogenase